jgi:Helix-turn-helix domain
MGFGLRTSAEIGDWLTELAATHPAVGLEVGAALTALLAAPKLPGPPLVTDPAAVQPLSPAHELARLDGVVRDLRLAVARARAEAANAAMDVRRVSVDINVASQEHSDQDEMAALRRRLAGARLLERQLTEHSQRSQQEVDTFGLKVDAAKTRYEAAVRSRDARAAVAAADDAAPDDPALVAAETAVRATLAHVRALADEGRRMMPDDRPEGWPGPVKPVRSGPRPTAPGSSGAIRRQPGPRRPIRPGTPSRPIRPDVSQPGTGDEPEPGAGRAGTSPPRADVLSAPGLLELRADPLGTDIRLLFAVEPRGTITVLAVLEGEAAVKVHRDKAMALASELLAEIRAGEWPPDQPQTPADVEVAVPDATTFLERFFPANADAVRLRAGRRADPAYTLAGLRQQRGIALAELAGLTGISAERLWVIEDGGWRVAQVREVFACLRALGASPELMAELDGLGPASLG